MKLISRNNKQNWAATLLIFVLAISAIVSVVWLSQGGSWLQLQQAASADSSLLAYLISIVCMTIAAATALPVEAVALANVMLFEPWQAFCVTWLGAMCGATLVFFLVRWMSQPFHSRLQQQLRWQKADQWIQQYGCCGLLLARLIPLVPFFILNTVAGLSRLSWRSYLMATALGILPLTTMLTLAGMLLD